jgi:hypothetical protein
MIRLTEERQTAPGCIRTRRGETRRFTLAGFLARRLVAGALPARDPAAVVPLDGVSRHAAALSWADGDTAWTDANCGVGVIPATVLTIIMGGVVDMQPVCISTWVILTPWALAGVTSGKVVSTAADATKAIFIMGSPPWHRL